LEQVGAILDEALKETVGISSKKWALVLVALVVGAMGAFWLVRRARSPEPAAAPVDLETT
jgi:hypothetical protein